MRHDAWLVVLVAASGFGLVAGPSAQAADPAPRSAETIGQAITGGKLGFNLRPRYEFVDQDGKEKEAHALTNRTLLGWRTSPYREFSAFAEVINVLRIGEQRYNDTPTPSPVYPTVADPENTDFNQLYLDYTGLPQTKIRAGRMSVKLDNVRFVGNVEFRQVMQVFNGVMLENRSIRALELNYAHFQRVKNIFAQQKQTRIDLFRAAWTFMPESQLVGFAYFQDQPNTGQSTGFADNSNRIVGVRANGAYPLGQATKLIYTAEYAVQDDYAGGDDRIDASYWRLGGGAQWGATFVRLDHDSLGSNNGLYGFQTPLGTNHLFQGWTDLFLTTPAQGIRDTYVTAGTDVKGVKLYTEVHDFRSDFGSIRYGWEVDLRAAYAFDKRLTGQVEYAHFREDDQLAGAARKPDTDRLWLTLIFSL
jgi:hypothetical protein